MMNLFQRRSFDSIEMYSFIGERLELTHVFNFIILAFRHTLSILTQVSGIHVVVYVPYRALHNIPGVAQHDFRVEKVLFSFFYKC